MSNHQVIIQSKINSPTLRNNVLLRPRVLDELNQWVQNEPIANLLLVSAPAGSGKTTLLASWVNTIQHLFAWLSLSPEDDTFPRFIFYVLSALKKRNPNITFDEQITSREENITDQIDSITSALMRELMNFGKPIILILEDYHVIRSPSIHKLIEVWIETLHPQVRIVLLTRSDPPLPLAKWRMRGQLTEIRTENLRFTNDEATLFFKQVMKMNLPEQEITRIEKQTEGWVAGLQLVALSLRKDKKFNSFNIQGNQRNIADYLMTEVLNQLSDDLKFFLLKTSILKRLNTSLCNTVLGHDDSQKILEKIEAENLFIVSLDTTREWFRYHHLFTDFLINKLNHEFSANEIQELHGKASHWFVEKGFLAEAIEHALAAKNFEYAACLIGPQAEKWMRRGEISAILETLKKLPDFVVKNHADLCIWYGWAYAIRGELRQAEAWVSEAEGQVAPNLHELTEGNTNSSITIRNAYTQIFAIRAMIARQQNAYPLAIKLGEQALSIIPENNLELRAIVLAGLSSAKIALGDLSQADEITNSTRNVAQQAQYPYITFSVLMNETVLALVRGQLFKVYEVSKEALQLCERESMAHLSFLPHIRLGQVHYLWNQLKEAEIHIHKGIENPQFPEYALSVCNGTVNLALLQIAQGKSVQALETLEKVKDIARIYQVENAVERANGLQAMIHLSTGDIQSVTRWVKASGWEKFNPKQERINFPDDSFSVFCHYLILYEKDWNRAHEILRWRKDYSIAKNRIGFFIDTCLLSAMLCQIRNQNDLAMQNLYHAIKIAEPEKFLHPFIDYEKKIQPLLNQIPTTHEAYGFAQKILSNFTVPQMRQSNLIESLNEQEMKILQLIAQGYTNPEIAQQLLLAVSTVRWYVKHIYRKLGVHNRTQATIEAQKQDII